MISEFNKSNALKERYRLEQSEGLNRINRVATWMIVVLVAYLTIFSDPSSFPQYSAAMLPGRLVAIGVGIITGILSFLPAMRRYGVHLSLVIFLAGGFMMAWLTGVMNNHTSSIVTWIFVSIIFCGIYPLPLIYSAIVVLISDVIYLIAFFTSGYVANVDFQQVLVNVNSASIVTLAFKIGINRIRKREFYFRTELQSANAEIAALNDQLQDENLRLTHELQVAQHIQSVVLPRRTEYKGFPDIDIACQMIPAAEVGGDYYDTIRVEEGGMSLAYS